MGGWSHIVMSKYALLGQKMRILVHISNFSGNFAQKRVNHKNGSGRPNFHFFSKIQKGMESVLKSHQNKVVT